MQNKENLKGGESKKVALYGEITLGEKAIGLYKELDIYSKKNNFTQSQKLAARIALANWIYLLESFAMENQNAS